MCKKGYGMFLKVVVITHVYIIKLLLKNDENIMITNKQCSKNFSFYTVLK